MSSTEIYGLTKNSMKKHTETTYLGSVAGYKSQILKSIYTLTSINSYRYINVKNIAQAQLQTRIICQKILQGQKKNKFPEPRCWGWLPSLKEAQKAVKANAGDMAECCYYTHAVIEKVAAGIPAAMFGQGKTWWYEWCVDPEDPHKFRGKWVKCDKPNWAGGICGWSIG